MFRVCHRRFGVVAGRHEHGRSGLDLAAAVWYGGVGFRFRVRGRLRRGLYRGRKGSVAAGGPGTAEWLQQHEGRNGDGRSDAGSAGRTGTGAATQGPWAGTKTDAPETGPERGGRSRDADGSAAGSRLPIP